MRFLKTLAICFLVAITCDAKHLVIDGSILNEGHQLIRQFPCNFCIFLNDGSYVGAVWERPGITRYSSRGEQIWHNELLVHHSMTLSKDGKSILAVAYDTKKSSPKFFNSKIPIRYDQFVRLDSKTGRLMSQFSWATHIPLLFEVFPFFTYQCPGCEYENKTNPRYEITHFNSFNEIPVPSTGSSFVESESGDFISATIGSGNSLYVFDSKSLKFKSRISLPLPRNSNVHDPQVLPSGQILFYLNDDRSLTPNKPITSINILDIKGQTITRMFPRAAIAKVSGDEFTSEKGAKESTGADETHSQYSPILGGVQPLSEGFLFNINSENMRAAVLIDNLGQVKWAVPNPARDASGKPKAFMKAELLDLTEFLKNNSL